MGSFSSTTSPRQVVQELFEDHRGDFEAYLYRKITHMIPINTLKGFLPILDTEQGKVGADDPSRIAVAGPGGEIPFDNAELSDRPYIADLAAQGISIPKQALKEAEAYTSTLDTTLKDRCGHTVCANRELRLATILRGDGLASEGRDTTIVTLTNAERFDNYGTSGNDYEDYSRVVTIIKDMIKLSNGSRFVMGSDVADALCEHPELTGRRAGSGQAVLTYEQLVQKLQGYGASEVWIGKHDYTSGAREGGYNRREFMLGVFAVMQDKAILRPTQEELHYDAWEKKEVRGLQVSAAEVSGLGIPIKNAIVTLKNVLTP